MQELMRDQSLGRVWLICDGPAAVAYLVLTFGFSLEYQGRDSFVDEIFLRADYRGKGWGKRAMQYAEDAARGFGIRAIHLEAERRNAPARAFYRGRGFEDRDRCLMTKRLGP